MGLSDELRDEHGAVAGGLAHGLTAACIDDPRARLQRGPTAGERVGRGAVDVCRRLPAGLERTATAGWSADGRDRRRVYPCPEPRRPLRSGGGKSLLAFRREAGEEEELSSQCLAFVQTYDEKPKRRLFEVLRSQGLTMNQPVEFLSDGGEDVRNVQLYLNAEAEHLLDWFHLTMRLTVLLQTAKGMPEKIGEGEEQYELRPQVEKQLESIKWYLWHGNSFQALNRLESLEMDLEAAAYESKDDHTHKALKGVQELHTYVERNQQFLPNYGERYRHGERIASGFVESAVNQVVSQRMVKLQQMQWSQRGAHLLLQIRTRVLNEEWEETFRRWYPGFRPQTEEQSVQKAA